MKYDVEMKQLEEAVDEAVEDLMVSSLARDKAEFRFEQAQAFVRECLDELEQYRQSNAVSMGE